MKGTIFVEFLDTVEQLHGLDMVDAIMQRVEDQLSTGGAYTSVGNYPHAELLAMATALSTITGTEMPALLKVFARHLMATFQRLHPEQFDKADNVFDFLLSVDQQIHADVRKIYPDANPPLVTGEMQPDGSMLLHYASQRPLAELALALALVSGEVFAQPLVANVIKRGSDDKSITIQLSTQA